VSAIIGICFFLNARRTGFLPADLFPGEGPHFAPKVFDASVGNGIVEDFLDDRPEVGKGMNWG
jgi:hypothetical protein